jgi:hypothetical protein
MCCHQLHKTIWYLCLVFVQFGRALDALKCRLFVQFKSALDAPKMSVHVCMFNFVQDGGALPAGLMLITAARCVSWYLNMHCLPFDRLEGLCLVAWCCVVWVEENGSGCRLERHSFLSHSLSLQMNPQAVGLFKLRVVASNRKRFTVLKVYQFHHYLEKVHCQQGAPFSPSSSTFVCMNIKEVNLLVLWVCGLSQFFWQGWVTV